MIVICHGMVKSASSFASQIVLSLLEANSLDKISINEILHENEQTSDSNNLFISDKIDLANFLQRAFSRTDNKYLVLKSHSDFPFACRELMNSENIKCIATYRNPAEIALSLMDAGKKDEALGRVRFNSYKSIQDTLETIDWQISCFSNWALNCPSFLPLYYDHLTTEPVSNSRRIAEFLGFKFEESMVESLLQNQEASVWEFNKGILGRAEKEMDKENYATLRRRWSEFYRFIEINRNAY